MYIIRGLSEVISLTMEGVPDYVPALFAEAVVYHISELLGQHT